MIAGCVQHGQWVFCRIIPKNATRGCEPRSHLLCQCSQCIHHPNCAGVGQVCPNTHHQAGTWLIGNALINIFLRCGSLADTCQVLDGMPRCDVVPWTAMISGYAQHQHGKEALKLFWWIQREGLKPNEVTFRSVVKACSSPEFLEEGNWVLEHILKRGFEPDVGAGNTHALITMYARCGSVVDACQILDNMPGPTFME